MMKQTPLKKVPLIFFSATLVVFSACGVKGPPEPPLVNEASVKRAETPEPPAEPVPPPVIFPDKTKKKSKAEKSGQ